MTAIAQKNYGMSEDYGVTVANPDSSVKARVLYENKKVTPKPYLMYFWYSSNAIQYTQGSYDGKLLHGEYSVFYPNGNPSTRSARSVNNSIVLKYRSRILSFRISMLSV